MDAHLDCEDLLCPLPVLRARKRLLTMTPGEILHLRATDKMAMVDVPHFCAEAGHTLLGTETIGPVTTYRIRRG